MKVVFDTNVLVAAFLTEGVCAKLLVRARKGDFDLVLCPSIIQEFESVLKRKFSITLPEIAQATAILAEAAKEIRQQANPPPLFVVIPPPMSSLPVPRPLQRNTS